MDLLIFGCTLPVMAVLLATLSLAALLYLLATQRDDKREQEALTRDRDREVAYWRERGDTP